MLNPASQLRRMALKEWGGVEPSSSCRILPARVKPLEPRCICDKKHEEKGGYPSHIASEQLKMNEEGLNPPRLHRNTQKRGEGLNPSPLLCQKGEGKVLNLPRLCRMAPKEGEGDNPPSVVSKRGGKASERRGGWLNSPLSCRNTSKRRGNVEPSLVTSNGVERKGRG